MAAVSAALAAYVESLPDREAALGAGDGSRGARLAALVASPRLTRVATSSAWRAGGGWPDTVPEPAAFAADRCYVWKRAGEVFGVLHGTSLETGRAAHRIAAALCAPALSARDPRHGTPLVDVAHAHGDHLLLRVAKPSHDLLLAALPRLEAPVACVSRHTPFTAGGLDLSSRPKYLNWLRVGRAQVELTPVLAHVVSCALRHHHGSVWLPALRAACATTLPTGADLRCPVHTSVARGGRDASAVVNTLAQCSWCRPWVAEPLALLPNAHVARKARCLNLLNCVPGLLAHPDAGPWEAGKAYVLSVWRSCEPRPVAPAPALPQYNAVVDRVDLCASLVSAGWCAPKVCAGDGRARPGLQDTVRC